MKGLKISWKIEKSIYDQFLIVIDIPTKKLSCYKLDKAQMSKSQLYICQIHATTKNMEFGEVWAKLAGVVRRNLSSKRDF